MAQTCPSLVLLDFQKMVAAAKRGKLPEHLPPQAVGKDRCANIALPDRVFLYALRHHGIMRRSDGNAFPQLLLDGG